MSLNTGAKLNVLANLRKAIFKALLRFPYLSGDIPKVRYNNHYINTDNLLQ